MMLLNAIIWRGLVLALLGIPMGIFGMWVVDREPPTTVLRFEVTPMQVLPGGTVEVRYFVRRIRSCAIIVDRVLYDAKGVRTPLEDRNFVAAPGPLGDDNYVVAINLPDNFALGRGRYRATSVYRCNPLHGWFPITVFGPDVYFDVVAQTKQSKSQSRSIIGSVN